MQSYRKIRLTLYRELKSGTQLQENEILPTPHRRNEAIVQHLRKEFSSKNTILEIVQNCRCNSVKQEFFPKRQVEGRTSRTVTNLANELDVHYTTFFIFHEMGTFKKIE